MPRISVVLPNYNYARYLKERFRSILAQRYTDFELLYLDDASTDESNRIAAHFAGDSRVRMHCFTDNSGGVYERRAAAVAAATGEWIWFAEADDSAHPLFLERLVALIDAHPGVGIAHSRMVTFDPAGRIVGLRWAAIADIARRLECGYAAPGAMDAVDLTAGCFYSSSSGILLRRDALIEAGGYDPRLRSAADWDLYLRMLRIADVVYTPEPLAYYRSHRNSVTKRTATVVRLLEDAYVVACACAWISADPRIPMASSELVRQRLRSRLFDLFADGNTEAPARLRFAAETIRQVEPDGRLARLKWIG